VERLAERKNSGGGSAVAHAVAAALLGQAARDCGARRFVTSFAKWAGLLIAIVKPDKHTPSTPAAIAAAQAITDVLTRAGSMMDVPGVRKEAAGVVQRGVPPVLAWLEEHASASTAVTAAAADDTETAAVVALALIQSALRGHPASVRPRADAVEAALVRVMYSRAASPGVATEAGACLAMLPRAGAMPGTSGGGGSGGGGDGNGGGGGGGGGGGTADPAAAWSSLSRRCIIATHDALDTALQVSSYPLS